MSATERLNDGVRDLPVPSVPAVDDADDLDLSSFEVVTDICPKDQSSDEEPEASDVPADNSGVDHNVNEVVDDVINGNVNTASTYDDDVPTGGPLDNEVIVNAPAELDDNEQGASSSSSKRHD